LSGTPEEAESNAHSNEPTHSVFSPQLLTWGIRLLTVAYISFALYQLLADDEVRLHLLHAAIRTLQTTARLFGGWALNVESHYNEYVNTLH
jgi:hypothetical protein